MKNMEILDREDLLIWDTRNTRGHEKKLKKDNYRRDVKRNSFPHRVVDVWNNLDEKLVCAKTIHVSLNLNSLCFFSLPNLVFLCTSQCPT